MAINEELKIFAVMTAVVLPGVASAQSTGTQGPVEAKSELTFSIEARHDSNVARGSAARAAQRNLVRADERFTPTASLSYARPFGRNSIGVDASLGYNFYRQNTRLNRERLQVAVDGRFGVAICDLQLQPSISRRQSDLGDIAALNQNGIDSVRNVETVQSYNGNIACGSVYGLRPTAMGGREIGDNDTAVRRRQDYRTTTYGGGLSYTGPALGTATLMFTRAETDYPNRLVVSGTGDGYSVNNYRASIARSIGSRFTGSAEIAYADLQPRRAGVKSFGGITWDAQLTALVGSNIQVKGAISKKVMPSLLTDSVYHVDESYSLDATYAFGTRFSLKVGGVHKPRRYEGAGAGLGPILTRDTRNSAFATLQYNRSTRLQFFLDGGYEERKANDSFYNFNNVYVALRTQVKF